MRGRRRTILLLLILVTLLGVEGALAWRRSGYRAETARLREGMSDLERRRADALVAADADRAQLHYLIAQRQARGDDNLHLAVHLDSGYVALDRGAARLRVMPARIGPARRVGLPPDTVHVAPPLGMRALQTVLGAKDSLELPAWLWADRGQVPPDRRLGAGWTGPLALVTTGGTLLYSLPEQGPLADSSYVMPGAIRLEAADLRAIRENLSPGMRVYFY
ncbi:MAG: hypothetical protein C0516_10225 [Gemmatimonas sp.]|uniref:hypothetical protein n=1 Tax=Gemmatimonas sp. UBA7669 TaxID=1946568 RepID=UPI0025C2A148|nr:hypothetical protein [Gemmatimonas sp. UBA7669]MBA3918947.1 hypothetical protein [Gemmatimonas sp.]